MGEHTVWAWIWGGIALWLVGSMVFTFLCALAGEEPEPAMIALWPLLAGLFLACLPWMGARWAGEVLKHHIDRAKESNGGTVQDNATK